MPDNDIPVEERVFTITNEVSPLGKYYSLAEVMVMIKTMSWFDSSAIERDLLELKVGCDTFINHNIVKRVI